MQVPDNLPVNSDEKYVLAIETAFTGSLSILSNQKIIAGWRGSHAVSRAEDVLAQIAGMLSSYKIAKKNIERIVVSKGAGSLTAEKIGLAIAQGFCKSIGCRLVEGSIFKALLKEIPGKLKGRYLTAVATQKGVQYIEFDLPGKPSIDSPANPVPENAELVAFAEKGGEYRNIAIIAAGATEKIEQRSSLIIIEKTPAEILGSAYASDNEIEIHSIHK